MIAVATCAAVFFAGNQQAKNTNEQETKSLCHHRRFGLALFG